MKFCVLITTYNRASLVGRAIGSAISQDWPDLEVLVVDDASTDDTANIISTKYPHVRYLRQETNHGAGAARNRGIHAANSPWIVVLDDDDELLPGALKKIAGKISNFSDISNYPVYQFAHSNGYIPEAYLLINLDHYLSGIFKGDFIPVINKLPFITQNLAYPEICTVGEHLLWWRIARTFGIPTWNEQVTLVHDDAPHRLTSSQNQIEHARDYAELQELTLTEFDTIMREKYPVFYRKKLLGAATYWLLAGERQKARTYLSNMLHRKINLSILLLWGITCLPLSLVKKIFITYRKCTQI